MKKIKLFIISFVFILACFCPVFIFSACGQQVNVAKVTFDGFATVQELNESTLNQAEIPTYTFEDKTLVGWATNREATTADIIVAPNTQYTDTVITYTIVKPLLDANGAVTLYPVYESKIISLTFNGINGVVSLDSITQNAAIKPNITLEGKQQLLGWATSGSSTTPDIVADADITYSSVKALATDGVITLHPVIHTYDMVVVVWDHWINSKTDFNGETIVADIAQNFTTTADIWYRHYTPSSADTLGTSVNTDGDVDVIIGAGGNVSDKVANVLAKSKLIATYNMKDGVDGSRYAALLTANDYSNAFYAFMTGKTSEKVIITFNGVSIQSTVYSLAGNAITVPTYTPAQGLVFFGWATTDNAEIADFGTTATITHTDVKDLATEGALTLYPVCLDSRNINATFVCDANYSVVLNNISKNAAQPTTVTVETGKELKGWSTTNNATEIMIGANAVLDYEHLQTLATEGNLTLYPVIGDKYDLVVMIHTDNSGEGSSSVWFTTQQVNDIKTGFLAYLQNQSVATGNLNINWLTTNLKANGSDAAITNTYNNGQVDGVEVAIGRYLNAPSYNTQTYATGYLGTFVVLEPNKDSGNVSVGILDGKETNSLAVHLYTYLTTSNA